MTIAEIMAFFGITPDTHKASEIRAMWLKLSVQDRAELKDGLKSGSMTYADA